MNLNCIENAASEPAFVSDGVVPESINSGGVINLQSDAYDATVFEATSEYLKRGWHILPFNRTVGYCTLDKEQQQAFKCVAKDISTKFMGVDVGVDLHASNLVGIDVDCPEAAAFLRALLPPTCVIGREGKSTSWMFYRLNGTIPKNVSFRDYSPNGQPGPELGGVKVKAAVALPPSRHRKTQEALVWKNDVEPVVIEAEWFMRVVSICFALALIARRWPGPGCRHEPTLALAGTLVRAGCSLDEAVSAIQVLVELTNDHHLEDRRAEVKSTYERYHDGKHTSGLPILVKLLDPAKSGQAYLEQNIRAWLGTTANDEQKKIGTGPESTDSLGKYALSAAALLAKELPEQEFIVHPWLPVQALAMLFAVRGVGKTWASLELAISVALGRDFIAWPVTKPRRVLFIDGEMPLSSLQFRLKRLLGNNPVPPNLTILSSELLLRDNAGLNIGQPNQQQRVDDYLSELAEQKKAPDLIILDNLSSLVAGVDENSNSDLDLLLRWLMKLRSQGYAVMLVHHAGRNGDQRGASRREDLLDTVIKLERREGFNLEATKGACFDISFTKLRGEPPKPISLFVALAADEEGNLHWVHEEGQQQPAYMKIVRAIHELKPASQSALAKKLGCSRQHVHTQVKIGAEKGLLKVNGLSLTEKGIDALATLTQDVHGYSDAL